MIKNGLRFKVGNKDVYGMVDGFNNIKKMCQLFTLIKKDLEDMTFTHQQLLLI